MLAKAPSHRSQHELIFVFKNGDAPHINSFGIRPARRRAVQRLGLSWRQHHSGKACFDDLSLSIRPSSDLSCLHRFYAATVRARRHTSCSTPGWAPGTTIMAAEWVGRRAYGLELDPLYVDAAVRRWQAFTKQDAILKRDWADLRGGRTWPFRQTDAEGQMTTTKKERRSVPRVGLKPRPGDGNVGYAG